MKRLVFVAILVLFVTVINGCAVAPKPRIIEKSFDLEYDYDAVWQSVIHTFAEHMYGIDNMEKDSGLITTDWHDLSNTLKSYADCGSGGLCTSTGRRVKFNIFLRKHSNNKVNLTVNCDFEELRDCTALTGKMGFAQCVSTGELEARLYKEIMGKLKIQ